MQSLDNIKKKIAGMAGLALKMWQMTHRTFIEHDVDLISGILEDENRLNDLEKEITQGLVEVGRMSPDKVDKAKAIVYIDVVGDLELIGDYCKDMLERVQIKIEENLLFSEEAVKEYECLYQRTEEALKDIVLALEKDNLDLARCVLKTEEHIDTLVDEYRRKHNQRLLDGVCSPMACNMFLNMLDFTAAVYYHAKKVARNLQKIKQ